MNFITPSQCRGARGLLGWSQPDLAEKCKMHVQTISAFENETGTPTKNTLEKIRRAFENNGLEFTQNGGIQPNISGVTTYEGREGFRLLMDDLYFQTRHKGGKLRLWNGTPDLFIKWLGKDWYSGHAKRMMEISDKFSFHITIEEGNDNFIAGDFAEYQWVPKGVFNNQIIYCYGGRVAFLKFEDDNLKIFIHHSQELYDSLVLFFDYVWNEITIIPNPKESS